ncbi:UPF0598 protein CG30010-like [Paramacrobiotus metropolitanus]|uniref:UPF0598 protein CG30010-like n=1 Tax=Paramacrobiotus metropolitanus TaxID=2943436 RepID=UPI0024456365|nr:UPF0598 protein CG30010-like [Paramacrobiotus metropolitanus]
MPLAALSKTAGPSISLLPKLHCYQYHSDNQADYPKTKTWTAPVYRMCLRKLHYVQGQSPEPKIREYFYYIDHQGQLFLDDAKIKNFTSCFKEKKFLHFFTSRLKVNTFAPERYPEFPYLSPCGRERNFVRCDDRPIVYTHLIEKDGQQRLSYNGGGDLLSLEFIPELLSMDPTSGRVYYPSPPEQAELGRALIKSSLAIEFSKGFVFESGDESRPPKWFNWLGQKHTLKNTD